MQRHVLSTLLGCALMAGTHAWADPDAHPPATPASQARNPVSPQEEQWRKEQNEKDRQRLEADMYRAALGAQAFGKSDADVIQLMKARP